MIPRSASAICTKLTELELHGLNIRSSAAVQHNQTDLDFDSEEVEEQLDADMIIVAYYTGTIFSQADFPSMQDITYYYIDLD